MEIEQEPIQQNNIIKQTITNDINNLKIDTEQSNNNGILEQGQNLKQKPKLSKTDQEIDDLKWQVFDLIRTIKDPEFPQTLEDLKVIQEQNIHYEELKGIKLIQIVWVPTVPNCHLANQIGLSIITKLQNELYDFDEFKIQILVKEGTHQDKQLLDKQINDKERIAAAQENETLMTFINSLISYGLENY